MIARYIPLVLVLFVAQNAIAQGLGMGRHGDSDNNPHDTIHALLAEHEAIERRVVDLPNGVETWTESDDPEVAILIQTHVHQMKDRLESGRPMRRWDPLFAALFEHSESIEMTIEDTPRGAHVIETSDDLEVIALIRQHAHRAINEFVERGMDRAHEPTPLPSSHPEDAVSSGLPSISTFPEFDDERFSTATLFENESYRVVGFSFLEGQSMPEHSAAVDAYVVVTEGRVRISLGNEVHVLSRGDGIVLPKDVPHQLEATVDTRMLLVRN